MKRTFLTLILACILAGAFAQDSTTVKQDTVVKKKKSVTIKIDTESGVGVGNDDDDEDEDTPSKAPGFSFGITFSRFDLGYAKLIDNGSFTLSPQNQFLSYRAGKTSTVGFDVLQMGYRFNSNFKIYLAGGIDWVHIRLREDITILPNEPVLTYRQDTIDYSKNRFSSTYVRIPLAFEFRTRDDNRGRKFRFVAGPEIGFLLNGKVKQISDENGKQKFKDDYHYTTFRYGAVVRVGYGGLGLFAKYYFNDMFENSPAQDGLRNMSFGLMAGF
ncbi:outer membrane beta-barrel protein [Pedobacter sp. HMF7647]|uniref:Outer membrane beta-barrel protein n=1 Tax=Hufsiella arboris TaxID=2695275 RepID=A0A7K1Y846_9SPHI|nr:outer membrane beta-barrel protein [Hufsiella arboris]MXV50755.1 outer membrane beta-barrel protein [Hufsiella arboris]